MSKFNFEEMIAALSPKREAVELNGFIQDMIASTTMHQVLKRQIS